MEMLELLNMVVDKKASDLHLISNSPPVVRVNGELIYTHLVELDEEEVKRLIYCLMSDEQKKRFEEEKELDFSYNLKGTARFRVNVYFQRGAPAAALRLVPHEVLDFAKLGLPDIVKDLTRRPRGLVLVTGPTGSGKSTTLAAMISLINSERSCHIVTIEDPIEYTHSHRKSIISQREIGTDSHSFQRALREVLRQDPNVILIGELRDLETIQTAITAAETGHLVFGTLHTTDAAQTIDRIIDVFPPYQQQQVRTQLSITLQGVISQQLIINRDGLGRVPAVEVMIATPAVRNMIREGKTFQIYSNIEMGRDVGMQTLDQALEDLFKRNLIAEEQAIAVSREPEALQKKILARMRMKKS
jgi:twitching motility protein PilT